MFFLWIFMGCAAVDRTMGERVKARVIIDTDLATISCNQPEKSAQLIQLIDNYFNKPDIPIGVTKGKPMDT